MARPDIDRKRQASLFAAVVAASSLLLLDLCDAVFGCGCVSFWSGAARACNVHHASPPHCPWCAHPGWGGAVAFFSVTLSQAAVFFGPVPLGLGSRVALAVVALPLVGATVGLVQGLLFGYWS